MKGQTATVERCYQTAAGLWRAILRSPADPTNVPTDRDHPEGTRLIEVFGQWVKP